MFFIDLPTSLVLLIAATIMLWLPALLGSIIATIYAITHKQKKLFGVVGLLGAMFFGPILFTNDGESILLATLPTLALLGGTFLFAKYALWNYLPSWTKYAENVAVRATGTLILTGASAYASLLLFQVFA